MSSGSGLPSPQGLYDPRNEHDACGLGFVVDLKGRKSHKLVRDGLKALENLDHRGACGWEDNTGDGAGHADPGPRPVPPRGLPRRAVPDPGDRRARPGRVRRRGVLRLARPRAADLRHGPLREDRRRRRARSSSAGGGSTTDNSTARPGGPVGRAGDLPRLRRPGPGRRRRGPLRAQALRHPQAVRDARSRTRGSTTTSSSTSASLSSRTLVYKGMLTPTQLGTYFAADLGDERLASALCLFHSRFSTNTFPSWELAHPYRMISHNGEINTLRGNINWMRAREALFASELYEPGDVAKLLPIIREGLSDTACLDNAVELLVQLGLLAAPRHDDAGARGLGEPRDDVAGQARLLPLPHLPDGGLGRPGVDRLHRRQGRSAPCSTATACGPAGTGSPGTTWSSWARRPACSTSRPRTSSSRGGSSPARCSWSTSSRAGSSTTRS